MKVLLCLFLSISAFAQNDDAFLKAAIAAYDEMVLIEAPFSGEMRQALKTQKKLGEHLAKKHGKVVGYKAALTNVKAQEKFNVGTPVPGLLFEKMLHQGSAEIDAKFGIVPLVEGDLMVRVGDDKINKAISDEEFLASLDAVIPFLEFVDIMYKKGYPLNGAALTAGNAGTRGGILGKPVPLKGDAETLKKLANLRVEIRNSAGKIVTIGYSKSLLDHPINVVRWLRDGLLVEEKKLKKGDLISLGSMTKLLPAKSGEAYTATWAGLDGLEGDAVKVSFK